MVTFPENPYDGQQVVDRQPDGVTVVIWRYDESLNQWSHEKYGPVESYVFTDQVYVRDNVGEGLKVDPSELKTQKDVNHYLDSRAGSGDLEDLEKRVADLEALFHPWVEVYKFATTHQFDYIYWQPQFRCHSEASWVWEYQICLDARNNPDDWVDPSTLDAETKAKIGWNSETYAATNLSKTDAQITEYPYAKCRFHVMTELGGVEDEAFSCELPAWDVNECPPLDSRTSLPGKGGKGCPTYE